MWKYSSNNSFLSSFCSLSLKTTKTCSYSQRKPLNFILLSSKLFNKRLSGRVSIFRLGTYSQIDTTWIGLPIAPVRSFKIGEYLSLRKAGQLLSVRNKLACRVSLHCSTFDSLNNKNKKSQKNESQSYYDEDELSFGGGKNVRRREPEELIFDSYTRGSQCSGNRHLTHVASAAFVPFHNEEISKNLNTDFTCKTNVVAPKNEHMAVTTEPVEEDKKVPFKHEVHLPKLYVLDTNVILHDSSCIYKFGAANICIPIIVLEELDKFKRGNDELNRHAREFLRILDDLASQNKEVNVGARISSLSGPCSDCESVNFQNGSQEFGNSESSTHNEESSFLNQMAEEGFSLGANLGKIQIGIAPRNPFIETKFFYDSPDHRILGLVHQLTRDRSITVVRALLDDSLRVDQRQLLSLDFGSVPNITTDEKLNRQIYEGFLLACQETILVTKDTNLRMKARALGLKTEDYVTDRILTKAEDLYCGKRVVENVRSEIISMFYESPFYISKEALEKFISDPVLNENFILRNGSKSALASYSYNSQCGDFVFQRVEKKCAYRIHPRNAEQAFALHALLDKKISLVAISGNPGTGKTLLALAAALEQHQDYRQIYLSRPIVPLSNRDIGYLPGTVDSKIEPYMQPLFDNLNVIKSVNMNDGKDENKASVTVSIKELVQLVETEKLKITPLTFIRGRSFHNSFFIVDEAQNLTPHEVKTIITRAGEGTKFVFTGDVHQIDNPYVDVRSNGLSYLIERMKGQSLFAHISLEKGERSELSKLANDLL